MKRVNVGWSEGGRREKERDEMKKAKEIMVYTAGKGIK